MRCTASWVNRYIARLRQCASGHLPRALLSQGILHDRTGKLDNSPNSCSRQTSPAGMASWHTSPLRYSIDVILTPYAAGIQLLGG